MSAATLLEPRGGVYVAKHLHVVGGELWLSNTTAKKGGQAVWRIRVSSALEALQGALGAIEAGAVNFNIGQDTMGSRSCRMACCSPFCRSHRHQDIEHDRRTCLCSGCRGSQRWRLENGKSWAQLKIDFRWQRLAQQLLLGSPESGGP